MSFVIIQKNSKFQHSQGIIVPPSNPGCRGCRWAFFCNPQRVLIGHGPRDLQQLPQLGLADFSQNGPCFLTSSSTRSLSFKGSYILRASKLQLLLSAHRPSDLVILGRFQCVSMMDGVKLIFVKVYMVKRIASNTYSTLQCEEWWNHRTFWQHLSSAVWSLWSLMEICLLHCRCK